MLAVIKHFFYDGRIPETSMAAQAPDGFFDDGIPIPAYALACTLVRGLHLSRLMLKTAQIQYVLETMTTSNKIAFDARTYKAVYRGWIKQLNKWTADAHMSDKIAQQRKAHWEALQCVILCITVCR